MPQGTTSVEELELGVSHYMANPVSLDLQRGLPPDDVVELAEFIRFGRIPRYEVKLKSGKTVLMLARELDEAREQGDVVNVINLFNYGCLAGTYHARVGLSHLLGTSPENVIAGGTSSLIHLGDVLSMHMRHGSFGENVPWRNRHDQPFFLCPVPGYDRHHDLLADEGVHMIDVPLRDHGPDMDVVERLVSENPRVLGMIVVPAYSNPTGTTYSQETVERLCRMRTAAAGFRLLVDNAYIVHWLQRRPDWAPNFLRTAAEVGNPHRVIVFASGSKITIPGGSIAGIGASPENVQYILKNYGARCIAPGGDKISQVQHGLFLEDREQLSRHMDQVGRLLWPKLSVTLNTLGAELSSEFATWTKPDGGYFVSVSLTQPIAKQVVSRAAELGLKLTPAGAAFPHRQDPLNNHLRLAFTFPPIGQVRKAMELLCLVIKYETLRYQHLIR